MNTTTDEQNLLDASADDLKAMGLPPAFTLEELQAHLTEAEIAKLTDELGREPENEEIAAELQIPTAKVALLKTVSVDS